MTASPLRQWSAHLLQLLMPVAVLVGDTLVA